MIRNLARGSSLLGTLGLIGTLFFYFSPTVEAVSRTTDLLPNTQQNNQLDQTELPQIPLTASADIPDDNDKKTTTLKAMAFRATAYCLKGKTALGSAVRRGIVAADPRVLPLGSRIQIDAGSYSGTYTVADTGGAVRGRVLDIWVSSCSEAIRFGRKSVTVKHMSKKG